MDVKQFLIENKTINRSELARRMWPGNKKPEGFLSSKLIGLREFTLRDAKRVVNILHQMAQELSNVVIDQDYPNPTLGPKPKIKSTASSG